MKAYLDWIGRKALPVWATIGFDARAGRFRERLDLAGRPIDVPHRAMVQARQIYVFSHAALLGWSDDGARLAETAMASLLRDYLRESAGQASFAFSIDRGGAIVSDVRDAYTHAFVLFALAWQYRLTGNPRLLTIADKTIAFIDAALLDRAHGGLYDASPIAGRDKKQNPQMHLLEAYLFLEQAAPGRGYLERASSLVALFRRRLFSAEHGVLLEYFAEDWSPHPDAARAGLFEPGHHFEWVWLLGEYGRLAGEDMQPWTARLHHLARAYGIAASGLIFDEVGADLRARKRSHRVWPHTEAIKAAVARAAAGDAQAPALAGRMAGALLATFLDRPFAGGWIDHVDEAGRPLVDYVPASSLYHLFLAAAEAARWAGDAPL